MNKSTAQERARDGARVRAGVRGAPYNAGNGAEPRLTETQR